MSKPKKAAEKVTPEVKAGLKKTKPTRMAAKCPKPKPKAK